MYRAALRSSPRALRSVRQPSLASTSRRFLTTAPADKRRTWRSSAVRWGLAIAAVYWYSTSPIFADEPTPQAGSPPPQFSDKDLPTVDAVIEEKRRQTLAAPPPPPHPAAEPEPAAAPQTSTEPVAEGALPGQESPEALEEEAGQQGAFNPETGEINWDCPCLGGMAHGPCGEEFKEAFSCFVYSQEDPKGIECIDKFQHMRDCFRKYPEIYGSELGDDDDEGDVAPAAGAEAAGAGDVLPEPSKPAEASPKTEESTSTETAAPKAPAPKEATEPTQQLDEPNKKVEHGFPKKAVDATDANTGKEQ